MTSWCIFVDLLIIMFDCFVMVETNSCGSKTFEIYINNNTNYISFATMPVEHYTRLLNVK